MQNKKSFNKKSKKYHTTNALLKPVIKKIFQQKSKMLILTSLKHSRKLVFYCLTTLFITLNRHCFCAKSSKVVKVVKIVLLLYHLLYHFGCTIKPAVRTFDYFWKKTVITTRQLL